MKSNVVGNNRQTDRQTSTIIYIYIYIYNIYIYIYIYIYFLVKFHDYKKNHYLGFHYNY